MKKIKKDSFSDFPSLSQIEQIIQTESKPTDVGGEAFIRKYIDRGVDWFKELLWRIYNVGDKDLLKDITVALRIPEYSHLSPALSVVRAKKRRKAVKVGVRVTVTKRNIRHGKGFTKETRKRLR